VRTLAAAIEEHCGARVSFLQLSQEVASVVSDGRVTCVPCRRSLSRCMLDGFRREKGLVAEAIRELSPDVVHAQWTQLGHALGAVGSGLPCVVTAHDAAMVAACWNCNLSARENFCGLAGVAVTRKVLRAASHVVAVSPYVARHVDSAFMRGKRLIGPREPRAAVVIPDPVRLADAGRRAAPSGVLVETMAGCDGPVFTAIGHWGRLKNFALVLYAFRFVHNRTPQSRLVLVGKDLGRDTPAHRWAIRHGLAAGVTFAGQAPHEEILAFLDQRADCLVHPSRTEGFGLVVAEAMAHRVPVLVSRHGALPWLVEHGKSGVVVGGDSVLDWAAAMLAAVEIKRNPKAGAMINRAHSRIASLCSPETVARAHIDLYHQAIEQAAPAHIARRTTEK
jgi:L-malate glycosyltransferase